MAAPPPAFKPQPAGVAAAGPSAATKKVQIVANTAKAAAVLKKSVNINEADPNDPTKPKSGTLKGVQAAETVYRRRLEQQYVMNPSLWYLRLLIQWRTEAVFYWDLVKKSTFQDAATPVYLYFEEQAEAWDRKFLYFEELGEGCARVALWDEYSGEAKRAHRVFSDRMSIFHSEINLRAHMVQRGLQLQDELLREARTALARYHVQDKAEHLYRFEQTTFLERIAEVFEEATIRGHSMQTRDLEFNQLVSFFHEQEGVSGAETTARRDMERDFVAYFPEEVEPLYEQACVIDEEVTRRIRINAEVDSFLDMAFDALHNLLDLFYQDKVEQRRKQEEAEAQRRAEAAEAQRLLLKRHEDERADLETAEEVGRRNDVPPTLERQRVQPISGVRASTDDGGDAAFANGDDGDMDIEFRLVEVGPPLGFEVEEAKLWLALLDQFDQEKWAVEQQMASDAQQQERLIEVAMQRRVRVEQEEETARVKLAEILAAMDLAFREAHDKFLVVSKELTLEEAEQRATLEWAEVESRTVVSRFAPKKSATTLPPPVAVQPSTPPPPPAVDPQPVVAPISQQPHYHAPPPTVVVQPQPAVVYTQASTMAGPAPLPYRPAPQWAEQLPARTHVIYATAPAAVPLQGHPLPVALAPLPYDSKLFRRVGPDGGEISADLKSAEDEVESMVTAATLPLGVLEYELRARWVRTKQQLMDAIQQKLMEPLHQLAAELPDGEDIARRARLAVPPASNGLHLADPPLSLGWSPTKRKRPARLNPAFLTPPPHRSPTRAKAVESATPPPQGSRSSWATGEAPRRGRDAPLEPIQGLTPEDARAKLMDVARRESELREQVLRSMRGVLNAKSAHARLAPIHPAASAKQNVSKR